MMQPSIKAEARRIIEELPADATWHDLLIHCRERASAAEKPARERSEFTVGEPEPAYNAGTGMVRRQALELLQDLPDDTTWEGLAYAVYVRESVETGLHQAENGDTISSQELRQRLFGHA